VISAGALLLLTHVVVWHAYTGAEQSALEHVVQKYNASQRDVAVEAIAVPYGSFADKLQAAIPRGHGPDAFIAAHDPIGQWKSQGLLAPVDGDASVQQTLRTLWPQTVDPLREGGALWGLPLSWKSLVLFYRTDLASQPPAATEDLQVLAQRLHSQPMPDGRQRYALAYETGSFFYHAVWLHGFGGQIIPPERGVPTLETPQQLQALRFLRGLVFARIVPEDMTAVLVAQFFNEGRAATVISGPWFVGDIAPGVPYGVAPMPKLSATGRTASPLTSIEAGLLSAHSKHPQQALAFLSYLAGPQGALPRLRTAHQAVSEQSAWQDPVASQDPVLRAFFAQLPELVPSPKHPSMRAFWEPGEQLLRQVLRGVDPQHALRSAQGLLQHYLAPPPDAASETPYLVALSLALLVATGLIVRRALSQQRIARAWQARAAYAYLGPAAIALLTLAALPIVLGAALSLFALLPDGSWRFVGTRNFADILLCRQTGCLDPLGFYFTLLVTILWTLLNISLHVAIGVALALALREPFLKLRGLYRVLLIIPWAVPNYITALIWKGMFNRQFGAVNGLLSWLGLEPVAWFSSFATALAANVTTNVWLGFPFMMVVTLGHLAAIPTELEEAAMLDGATRLQRLRHIVLPLLMPAMLPSVLLGAVWTFNMFNVVFLVSGGEPDGATDILITQAYRWAFARGHRYGYAAAYAVLIFLVLLLQTALMRRVSDTDRGR